MADNKDFLDKLREAAYADVETMPHMSDRLGKGIVDAGIGLLKTAKDGGDVMAPLVRTIEYGFDESKSLRVETVASSETGHALGRDRSRERYAEPASAASPASASAQSKTEDLIRNGTPDQMVEALRAKREAAEKAAEAGKPKDLGGAFDSKAAVTPADTQESPQVWSGPVQKQAGPKPGS